uniref:ShKT domain-containing protein n=1 Tax=Gopherus agassizii TaxID=38772 RepID=A0A452I942_9SAUR
MILLAVFLGLAAVLQTSTGQTPELDSLPTDNINQQKEIVDKHNALRRQVIPTASNMLRMEWSPAAAKNAKSWANNCTLSHSPPNKRRTMNCGENLYMSTAPNSWSNAIQTWYNEVGHFMYGNGSTIPNAMIGHYTQVVWYRSYQIGCALAFCGAQKYYKYYYVCHYCPAGNDINLMNTPYKSGPVCGDCPNACDNGLCTNPCKYVDMYLNCPNLKVFPGCTNSMIDAICPASCRCTTEIK